jgi:DNA-directed RNA polymerase I subunit RPA2
MVAAFDPLSPSKATSSKFPDKTSFGTLTRERQNRHPNANGPDFQKLEELVRPHIESFDALTEGGDDGTAGLLQLGVQDIGEKVVFDGKPTAQMPFGNKITCVYHPRRR